MRYGITLTQQYTRPSRNDCFALALAKQENCTQWIVEQMILSKFSQHQTGERPTNA